MKLFRALSLGFIGSRSEQHGIKCAGNFVACQAFDVGLIFGYSSRRQNPAISKPIVAAESVSEASLSPKEKAVSRLKAAIELTLAERSEKARLGEDVAACEKTIWVYTNALASLETIA